MPEHPAAPRLASGRVSAQHPAWCDPAACDIHDIDPRHTSPPVAVHGDDTSAATLAVSRIDFTGPGGGVDDHGWVHALSVPLADVTIRGDRVILELSDEDADMLRARLEVNRARLEQLRGGDGAQV